MKKYGQVFLTFKKTFVLICTHCEKAIEDYSEFLNHVLEDHVDPLSYDNFESIIKTDISESSQSEQPNPILSLNVEFAEFKTGRDSIEESSCAVQSLNTEVDTSFKDDEDNDFSENENSRASHSNAVNTINENYNELTKKDVVHCPICNQPYYILELFKRHRIRNRCGYCPVCSVSIADVCAHVRRFHKDYYRNKKRLGEPIREINKIQEFTNETEISFPVKKLNASNLNQMNDKNENFEESQYLSPILNMQVESIQFNSGQNCIEESSCVVFSSNPEVKASLKKNQDNEDSENSENEDSRASHLNVHNSITKSHNNPMENDVTDCPTCGQFFYNLEVFEKHKMRNRCGFCSICSLPKGDVCAHIRRFHKEYYENKKRIRKPIREIKQRDELKDETEISLTEISITESYDNLAQKDVRHCSICGRSFHVLEKFKKHKAENRCGYCSICSLSQGNIYRHIKHCHKDYYENRKRLGKPIREVNKIQESKDENEVSSSVKKINSHSIYRRNDKNEKNMEGSSSKYVNPILNLQDEVIEFTSSEGIIEESLCAVNSSNTEIDTSLKENYNNDLNTMNTINQNFLQCPICFQNFYILELFKRHEARNMCGCCPVCSLPKPDVCEHIRRFHKDYYENKNKLGEPIWERNKIQESIDETADISFLFKSVDSSKLNRTSGQKSLREKIVPQVKRVPLTKEELLIKRIEQQTRNKNANRLKNNFNDFVMKCIYCNKKFTIEAIYNKHIKQHERKICKLCGKIFIRFENLKRHLLTHTGEKPYKCKGCSVSFADRRNLKEHFITRHTEGLNLKCNYENCDKVFKTNARRSYHESYAHTNKYKTICPVCGLTCKNSGALNQHTKKTHIKYEDRQFSCKKCEKKFAFKYELNEHEMIHLGKKRFFCEICTKGFVSRKSFRVHRQIHKRKAATDVKTEKNQQI